MILSPILETIQTFVSDELKEKGRQAGRHTNRKEGRLANR